MRKYIALVLTSTLLYGCGGTNGFEPAEEDSTQYSPAEATFEQLVSTTDSGFPVDFDEYLLFRDPVAFGFIYSWMTGERAPQVDFENGEVISIVVSELRSGTTLDFLSVFHHENATSIEILESHPAETPTMDKYPAAIAQFQLVGDPRETTFTRYIYTEEDGSTKMQPKEQQTFTAEPTYPELAKKDVEEWYDYNYPEESLPPYKQDITLIIRVDPVCPKHHRLLEDADLSEAGFNYETYPEAPTHARFCLEGSHYWLLKKGEETMEVFGPFSPGFSNDKK